MTPETIPVKVGDSKGAFKSKFAFEAFVSNAACVATETGLLASLVLSKFPKPTIAAVTPETVPVNVGDAEGAFKSNAVCIAAEIGLLTSLVLSTWSNSNVILAPVIVVAFVPPFSTATTPVTFTLLVAAKANGTVAKD